MTRTISLIAFFACFSAGAANAQTASVGYYEYELDSVAGAQNVYARIQNKAEATCIDGGRTPLYRQPVEDACIAELTEDIVAEIDHARLYRIHENLGGVTRVSQR